MAKAVRAPKEVKPMVEKHSTNRAQLMYPKGENPDVRAAFDEMEKGKREA